jgi:hypothetical protein
MYTPPSFTAGLLAIALFLWATVLSAATPIDPSGIYLFTSSYNGNPSTTESRDYLSIHRNGDRYIIINISRDLYYLSNLQLVLSNEAESNSIQPPIEEFTFTFTTQDGSEGVMPMTAYQFELLVPFPRTTAYLSAELPPDHEWNISVRRSIIFKDSNTVCFQLDTIITIMRCYTKIF